ncbi:MAG: hypothetical protein IJO62_05590 [Clostridia bacterium]|nr:hypothetical protein [Clostridia bacterium]
METDLLKDRIFDTVGICQRTRRPKFLGFLSLEETAFAKGIISKTTAQYDFFGGFEGAERVMLGCFPEWCEEKKFPIIAITAEYRKSDRLSHRDVLGSLMALGLKRETVGDILIDEGRAVIFLSEETVNYVMTQITKIGRVGVILKEGFTLPLPKSGELKEFSVTVSSERLDCVVAALCSVSRNKAVELIEQSLVTVNSVVVEKITTRLCDGDVISVRSRGKFIIDSLSDKTKKDRLVLKYKKYV